MEKYVSKSNLQYNVDKTKQYVENKLEDKQDVLVSGENIKTINNTSLLGEGNIVIEGVTDYTALNNLPQINGNTLTGDQTSNELGLQDTLENQVNIKSINGNSLLGSGNLDIGTNQAFPNSWPTTNSTTTKQFCDTVNADANAVMGMSYLGEVRWSDLPSSLVNAEVVVEIMSGTGTSGKVIHLVLTSGNRAPYRWEYTYWNNGSNISGWIGFQPELNSTQMNAVNSGITSEIVADIVNKSGDQIITGTKTISDTSLDIQKTNITGDAKWHLEEDQYGQLVISRTYNNSKAKMLQFNGSNILPEGNNSNLGSNNKLWNNLYLSGNLTDGTNSISVAELKNYYGFRVITAPSSTTLTDDELTAIRSGCIINGSFLGYEKIVFMPSGEINYGEYDGLALIGNQLAPEIRVYTINATSKLISLSATNSLRIRLGSISQINGKALPQYPSGNATYNLQQSNGTLQWNSAPDVASYNELGMVKLGSDTQSSQAIETASSIAGKQYPVQVDANSRASVNVPWTDTTYTAGANITIQNNVISADTGLNGIAYREI